MFFHLGRLTTLGGRRATHINCKIAKSRERCISFHPRGPKNESARGKEGFSGADSTTLVLVIVLGSSVAVTVDSMLEAATRAPGDVLALAAAANACISDVSLRQRLQ